MREGQEMVRSKVREFLDQGHQVRDDCTSWWTHLPEEGERRGFSLTPSADGWFNSMMLWGKPWNRLPPVIILVDTSAVLESA